MFVSQITELQNLDQEIFTLSDDSEILSQTSVFVLANLISHCLTTCDLQELALAPALETDDSDSESDSDEDQENTTSRAANTLITELPAAGQQGKPQS